jgi:hypothetical protein
MARVDLAIQVTTRDGIVPSYEAVAAANDAMFLNDGGTWLHVKNASGFTVNVVIETPVTVTSDALAVADKVPTPIANGSEALLGPWPTGTYNQLSGADVGKVYVNVDQAVTCAATRLGPAT